MADEDRHEHELLTEWYRHSHEGGEEPHEHEHTPEQAEAHEEAAEDDGKCPVCGEVHELAPEEAEEAEQHEAEPEREEEPTAEEEPEPEHHEPEEVHGPPQDEDEHGRRRHVVTSAWHAHRRK